MEQIEYKFKYISNEQQDILVALLADIGFHGFLQDNDSLSAFTIADPDSGRFNDIIRLTGVEYSRGVIPETNWNAKWEQDFEPITVIDPQTGKPFVYVRANFHPSSDAPYEIIITPKMSFGTGHHATTYGMIENMGKMDFKNKIVLDFGTGTGLLAILAEKLGAKEIMAIDNDEWSIRNAAENVNVNNCSVIKIIKMNTVPVMKCDIILANINLNVILANIESLKEACHQSSILLFSGILSDDESTLSSALKQYNIETKTTHIKKNWIVMLGRITTD